MNNSNNDYRTPQDEAEDLSASNNAKDNAAADLLRSGKLPDAEEGTLRTPNGWSGTGPASPVQPTPEQILKATEQVNKANEKNLPIVLRLLRQGGFDVGELAPGSAADAEGKEDIGIKFCEDILTRARWSLIPIKILVILFNRWLEIYHPDVPAYSWAQIKDVLTPLVDRYGWRMPSYNAKGNLHRDRPGSRMEGEEPLFKELKLRALYDFVPDPTKTYAGLTRK